MVWLPMCMTNATGILCGNSWCLFNLGKIPRYNKLSFSIHTHGINLHIILFMVVIGVSQIFILFFNEDLVFCYMVSKYSLLII